jgi:adenosylhomocysteine nucleosidase
MTGEGVVAVVAAMRDELAPLRARTSDGSGRLAGVPVALLATGEGAANARAALARMMRQVPVRAVLVVGVAGALTRGLRVGTLVVAERVHPPSGPALGPPEHLVAAAVRATAAERVRIWSRDELVCTVAEKASLGRAIDADVAAVVDLESFALADVARSAGLPWGVLRAVSDAADEELPAFLATCRDRSGAIRRSRVALATLARPGAIPRLLELRRRMHLCAEALANAAMAWLPHFASTPDVAAAR